MQEIVANPHIRIADLKQRLHLSRRQVQYRIAKINDWLQDQSLPTLQYHRTSGFTVSAEISKALLHLQKNMDHDRYSLHEQERIHIILLLLLSKTGDISLLHLTSKLDVSRNTVLDDLKKAKHVASTFSCKIEYSRRDGYAISGDEWHIRSLLKHVIQEIGNNERRTLLFTLPLSTKYHEKIVQIQQKIEDVERSLALRYIDESLTSLPYLIMYCWIRIQTQNYLLQIDEKWKKTILASQEYQALNDLFQYLDLMDPKLINERIYLTIQLLTTNLAAGNHLLNPEDQQLFLLTNQVIEQFEAIACVNLKDQTNLAKQLFQHLKPAYYRAKFGIKVNNPLYQTVIHEQPELHHLVKKALKPFHVWLGQTLSEEEAAFVTMHFGSWLQRQGTELTQRLKAVVVCSKGIAISRLLIHRLKEMFPEILFLDALSLRDFYEFPFSYQIVFSTVFVQTKAQLFMIKPIFDQDEEQRLYQQVMQQLYGVTSSKWNIQQIITTIRPYADIHDEQGLEKALFHLLGRQRTDVQIRKEQKKPVLADLITKDKIQLEKKIPTWEEAIRFAAQPLLNQQAIQSSYIDAMIDNIKKEGPYVVLTPKVAIPHARPEEGVNTLAMSMLILKESVAFPEEKPVNVIIILAATDNESHLKALAQLTELLSSAENIDQLIAAEEKSSVLETVRFYSQGDDIG